MGTIIRWMLQQERQFVIEKIKAPLLKVIIGLTNNSVVRNYCLLKEAIALSKKYPEPTTENTVFKNTKIRIAVRDEFFKHLRNNGRKPLLEAVFRIIIDECEHDGFYDFIHDWYFIEMLSRGWKPEMRGFPMYRYWDGKLPQDNCIETDPRWLETHAREACLK